MIFFTRVIISGGLFFLLINPGNIFADTVKLKNGKILEGRIIKQEPEYITIRTQKGPQRLAKKNITMLEYGPLPATQPKKVVKQAPNKKARVRPAMVRSLLWPGWGQWHQKRTGVAFLFAGLFTAAGYNTYLENRRYQDAAREMENMQGIANLGLFLPGLGSVVTTVNLELLFIDNLRFQNQQAVLDRHFAQLRTSLYIFSLTYLASVLDTGFIIHKKSRGSTRSRVQLSFFGARKGSSSFFEFAIYLRF